MRAMIDDDFAALIERAKAGDSAAFALLLQQFENDVRMMVRVRLPRVLRSEFDSLDFVQAVWQSVLIQFDEDPAPFADPGRMRNYLAAVARNKVLEQYRRKTRTKKYAVDREESLYVRRGKYDEPREIIGTDPSPSQEAQAVDCWDQLIEGSAPRDAEIIAFRRDGLTFQEIADRLGLHERTVRRVVDLARARWETRR